MRLKKALQIVVDLAEDNILDDFAVKTDPEILGPEQKNQKEAVAKVIAHIKVMGRKKGGTK